jgi:hypothetical protein
MRNLLTVAILLAILSTASAGVQTPEAVTKAFAAKFPKAEKVKWSAEHSEFEAEFVLNGIKMSAHFSNSGNWTETETDIAISELPKPAADYVAKNHPKAKITETARIERPGTGMDVVLYEAEIKENGKETDLILTRNGVLVK